MPDHGRDRQHACQRGLLHTRRNQAGGAEERGEVSRLSARRRGRLARRVECVAVRDANEQLGSVGVVRAEGLQRQWRRQARGCGRAGWGGEAAAGAVPRAGSCVAATKGD